MKLFSLLAALLFPALAPAADSKHHEHGKAVPSSAMASAGTKFVADANLRSGMDAALHAMHSVHEAKGKNRTAKVKKAGEGIEAAVNRIFAECKLEPAADAAIHPILAQLLEGASLLKRGKEHEGHEKVHHAFLKYEETFTHEGWAHGK